MRKYFITFAAIAILGMLTIYYGPTAFKSNSTGSTQVAGPLNNTNQTSTNAVAPSSASSSSSTTAATYKDGNYTGADEQNPYGDVQISITINGGKITTVNLLNMPNSEGRSQYLSSHAGPILKSQTLAAQSSQIDGVSGATYTSSSYQQSLQSALDQAKTS